MGQTVKDLPTHCLKRLPLGPEGYLATLRSGLWRDPGAGVHPSVAFCESIEFGELITRSILFWYRYDRTFGSRFTSGLKSTSRRCETIAAGLVPHRSAAAASTYSAEEA